MQKYQNMQQKEAAQQQYKWVPAIVPQLQLEGVGVGGWGSLIGGPLSWIHRLGVTYQIRPQQEKMII